MLSLSSKVDRHDCVAPSRFLLRLSLPRTLPAGWAVLSPDCFRDPWLFLLLLRRPIIWPVWLNLAHPFLGYACAGRFEILAFVFALLEVLCCLVCFLSLYR